MQKFAVAFFLLIFFNNITISHAVETERFIVKDIHAIAKQLNEAPFRGKIYLTINPTITRPANNVLADTYTHLSSIQKNLGTDSNLSFTKRNNGEQYANSMRFFSCSLANITCLAEAIHGMPDEGEIAAAFRLSENQFVTRSQQNTKANKQITERDYLC